MSNIFKIVHIKNNKIDKVYVFKGKEKKEDCFNNEEEKNPESTPESKLKSAA